MTDPSQSTIMVVEDEPLIGLDVESILLEIGASIIVVETIQRATDYLSAGALPALALLDIVLPDGTSFALARSLSARGVRIAFLTGYLANLPDDLKHLPLIEKPFAEDDLRQTVRGLLAEGAAGGPNLGAEGRSLAG